MISNSDAETIFKSEGTSFNSQDINLNTLPGIVLHTSLKLYSIIKIKISELNITKAIIDTHKIYSAVIHSNVD